MRPTFTFFRLFLVTIQKTGGILVIKHTTFLLLFYMFNGHETPITPNPSSSNSHRIPFVSSGLTLAASIISHYSICDLYAIASLPRSFLIFMLNLLINPQVALFFPSIKMAHNPVVNQEKKLREPQIEVFGSNQGQALHLRSKVTVLTLLCFTKPRYLSSSLQI